MSRLELVELSSDLSGLESFANWYKGFYEKIKNIFIPKNKKKEIEEEIEKLNKNRDKVHKLFSTLNKGLKEKYQKKFSELEERHKKLFGSEVSGLGIAPLIPIAAGVIGGTIGTGGIIFGLIQKGRYDQVKEEISKLNNAYIELYNTILNDPSLSPSQKVEILKNFGAPQSEKPQDFLGKIALIIGLLIIAAIAFFIFQMVKKK